MDTLTPLQSDLLTFVGSLPEAEQLRVLDLARSLSTGEKPKRLRGTPGKELLKFFDSLDFSKEDVEQMKEAIKDCEQRSA